MAQFRNMGESHPGDSLEVVCAWCGGVIRRARRPEKGMCQLCFARMMHDYLRTYQSHSSQPGTSER